VSSEFSSKANKERAVVVLLPLLVFQLGLLSLQIENPSGMLLFKSWTLTVQAPFVASASGITGGVQRVWRNYFWLVGARADNERLQEQVRRLALQNNSYQQTKQENIRLRRLLSLNDANAFKTIGARVVARTPSYLSNVIYINRGSADGVYCDSDASIGVIIERTRTPGVLRGIGDIFLDLNYIGNTEQVNVGDIVVSSGLDGLYPKGLAIGRVVDSRKGKSVYRSIKVEPGVDLIRLEEVSVLLQDFTAKPSGS
jgi:rod shape-determining protein MreC